MSASVRHQRFQQSLAFHLGAATAVEQAKGHGGVLSRAGPCLHELLGSYRRSHGSDASGPRLRGGPGTPQIASLVDGALPSCLEWIGQALRNLGCARGVVDSRRKELRQLSYDPFRGRQGDRSLRLVPPQRINGSGSVVADQAPPRGSGATRGASGGTNRSTVDFRLRTGETRLAGKYQAEAPAPTQAAEAALEDSHTDGPERAFQELWRRRSPPPAARVHPRRPIPCRSWSPWRTPSGSGPVAPGAAPVARLPPPTRLQFPFQRWRERGKGNVGSALVTATASIEAHHFGTIHAPYKDEAATERACRAAKRKMAPEPPREVQLRE